MKMYVKIFRIHGNAVRREKRTERNERTTKMMVAAVKRLGKDTTTCMRIFKEELSKSGKLLRYY